MLSGADLLLGIHSRSRDPCSAQPVIGRKPSLGDAGYWKPADRATECTVFGSHAESLQRHRRRRALAAAANASGQGMLQLSRSPSSWNYRTS